MNIYKVNKTVKSAFRNQIKNTQKLSFCLLPGTGLTNETLLTAQIVSHHLEFYLNRFIQCVVHLHVWALVLNIMFVRFIHMVGAAVVVHSYCWIIFHWVTYHNLSLYLLLMGFGALSCLGLSQTVLLWTLLCLYFSEHHMHFGWEYALGWNCWVTGYAFFSFIRCCSTVLQRGCSNLHSHKPCLLIRVFNCNCYDQCHVILWFCFWFPCCSFIFSSLFSINRTLFCLPFEIIWRIKNLFLIVLMVTIQQFTIIVTSWIIKITMKTILLTHFSWKAKIAVLLLLLPSLIPGFKKLMLCHKFYHPKFSLSERC